MDFANFCKVAKTFPNNKVDSALSGGQEFLPQKLFSVYTYSTYIASTYLNIMTVYMF